MLLATRALVTRSRVLSPLVDRKYLTVAAGQSGPTPFEPRRRELRFGKANVCLNGTSHISVECRESVRPAVEEFVRLHDGGNGGAVVAIEMDATKAIYLLRHSGYNGELPLPSVADGQHASEVFFGEFLVRTLREEGLDLIEPPQAPEMAEAIRAAVEFELPLWLIDVPGHFHCPVAYPTKMSRSVPEDPESVTFRERRDDYMTHSLLHGLHSSMPDEAPNVLAFVGRGHVDPIANRWNASVELAPEAHAARLAELTAWPNKGNTDSHSLLGRNASLFHNEIMGLFAMRCQSTQERREAWRAFSPLVSGEPWGAEFRHWLENNVMKELERTEALEMPCDEKLAFLEEIRSAFHYQ